MTIDEIVPISRNSNGLLTNIQYSFTEDGKIDWRKMIPAKFLYPNPQQKEKVEKLLNKSIKEFNPEVDKLPDNLLCVLLGGIKYLASIRGITKVSFSIGQSSTEYASVVCSIDFTPVYDSILNTYSDCGSASIQTTNDFGRNYLVEIASNRAFCRSIRNALGINIVAADELGPDKEAKTNVQSPETVAEAGSTSGVDLHAKAREKAKAIGFTGWVTMIGELKSAGIDVSKFETYNKIADIPPANLYAFLNALEKYQTVNN